jgi:hypothetical protein
LTQARCLGSLVACRRGAEMHPRTRATLDELERSDWFSAVGQRVEGPFIVVGSWEEAMKWCGSDAWQDLILEASNRYCEAIARRSLDRWNSWNEIVEEIRPVVTALVRRKIRSMVANHNLPKVFEDTVQWDILHLCMEAEYTDVYPPGFFASQSFWYVNGHFPCGWEGPFPEGKLVLY